MEKLPNSLKMEKLVRAIALAAACAMTALAPNLVIAETSSPQGREEEQEDESDGSDSAASARRFAGAVFAMTNATARNQIVTYGRASDGTLTRLRTVNTRGLGMGVLTDTQGPLQLGPDNRFLYAVNPGSDDISVFAVNGARLRFLQKIEAGDQPLSLTISGNLLYVLNATVAGNGIRGFRIKPNGTLTQLPNSFRALSSPIAVPGEVRFSPSGRTLVVTHKSTDVLVAPANAIDTFIVGADGYASTPIRNASSGLRPFSLAFRNDDRLVVTESVNGVTNLASASSYRLNADGSIGLISGSVANGQTDSCWVVITKDGRLAFTANLSSGTISSYSLSPSGNLTLINGRAAFLGDGSQPEDMSLSADSRYLFQLLRGPGAVASFRIEQNGSLTPLGTVVGGLPVGDASTSGLAAY